MITRVSNKDVPYNNFRQEVALSVHDLNSISETVQNGGDSRRFSLVQLTR